MKKDLVSMKTMFKVQKEDFRELFHHASMNLIDRIRINQSLHKMFTSNGIPTLRRERLELIEPELLYNERSQAAFQEVRVQSLIQFLCSGSSLNSLIKQLKYLNGRKVIYAIFIR